MCAQLTTDQLYTEARTRDCAAGLRALGTFINGRPSYFANGEIALIGTGDTSVPVLNGLGNVVSFEAPKDQDKALTALGLTLVRIPAAQATSDRRAQVSALIWRAGLLAKLLDTAFAHLSSRESGGQKTLQHQLVKASFTECFTASERVRTELPFFLDETNALDFDAEHKELSRLTTAAAKLMGGHGFLLGSLNSLETLSFVVSNLLAATAEPQNQRAAA